MSTTTYAAQLLGPATRSTGSRATGRAVRSLQRASRTGIGATVAPASSSSVSASPGAPPSVFTPTAPDARRSGRVLTTCATLVWLPVLVLTVLVFLLIGAIGGLAAAGMWTWRTVSPVQARPTDHADERADRPSSASSPRPVAAPSSRRVVRDRTIGYDA
ncbi:hypothetical protein [Cellulosimicrobium sp. TH-20]|uniref:hypothetical protein n=1 Tax=Cellulosimicrobium sp. TH-20 TaxID=1980001 RepID=UPI0011A8D03C|nr:hypothetical protein [Cellulosimicrobium sp. TH-20]